MKTKTPVCETCYFWEQSVAGVAGLCKRHSPASDRNGNPIFPVMPIDGWCGDYDPKESYIPRAVPATP